MNHASKILLASALTALAACNRHSNTPAPAAPPAAAPVGQAVPVPEPPPQVNEPQPVVKKDTATQKLFSGPLQAATPQPVHGTAILLRTQDGYGVRLEHLWIEGEAPTLDVVVSSRAAINDGDLADAVTIGEVKGTTGNMNYALPAGTDPGSYHSLALVVRGQNRVFARTAFGLM